MAELVDARDLKSQSLIEIIGFRPQTPVDSPMGFDGTKQDLQNIPPALFRSEKEVANG